MQSLKSDSTDFEDAVNGMKCFINRFTEPEGVYVLFRLNKQEASSARLNRKGSKPAKKKPFTCPIKECPEDFDDKAARLKHLKERHSPEELNATFTAKKKQKDTKPEQMPTEKVGVKRTHGQFVADQNPDQGSGQPQKRKKRADDEAEFDLEKELKSIGWSPS